MSRLNRAGIAGIVGGIVVIGGLAAVTLGREGDGTAHAHAADSTAVATARGGLAAADLDGDGIVYQSGMHPWIVEDEPGRCPICGMDLVPTPVGHVEEGVVRIDPVTLQNSGVRTAFATVEPLSRTVRTTGRFEADQQRATVVSPKVGGWIEQLHVNYEGARVRAGQPLLEIYSPELVSTQEEYLLALRSAERLGNTPDARRLVEAARRRLSFWDISDAQIRRLEETGTPEKTLTLHAPASGTVVSTTVVEGQRISAGQTLMSLADLSQLWLMVDVYEQDLAWVGVGTRAAVELPYDPGTRINGRIDYLYDELNDATRTLRARVRVPNPGLKLKPGMYATVQLLGGETAPYPVVPSEAVVRTGDRSVVLLALGDGRFMPAEVQTGVEADGRTQILQGLQGNEQVVTSAQFLIDSEARLSSAVGAMRAGHEHGSAPAAGGVPGGGRESEIGGGTADGGRPADGLVPAPASQRHRSGAPGAGHQAGASSVQSPKPARQVRITVGPNGFEPAHIELAEGVPTALTFVRQTEQTCATEVKIPEMGVPTTALPLDKPVTITVRPAKTGTFTFACPMDMIEGSLLVPGS